MLENNHPLDLALKYCIEGNPDESERILRSLPQNDYRVNYNLGWHELRHGNFQQGFEMMDYGRWINAFGSPPVMSGKPIWKDEPLKGKTLLFRSEGGLGDEIINIRFAKWFYDQGAKIIVSCDLSLIDIFQNLDWVSAFVSSEGAKYVYHDYWMPAMSAPRICKFDYDTLPNDPYINFKPDLEIKDKKLKVGIKWAGNPQFEHRQYRTFDPKFMLDLRNLDGISIYNLQKETDIKIPAKIKKYPLNSWKETANIVANMDLILTSCTSIAHLAAAMGKKTWIVIPVLPYYIWALPGNTSPWYKTVRLYRQTTFGDWTDPFNRIKKDLEDRNI